MVTRLPIVASVVLAVLGLAALVSCTAEEEALPSFHRWGKIELIFHGPSMQGRGDPNPFAIPFDVLFTGPDGSTHLAPGFYDGDGAGGIDGNIWRVRFSADQNGSWSFHTQSPEPSLNGLSGTVGVVDPAVDAPDLYQVGRLEYVGERYLKFREGGYWIKAGANLARNPLAGPFDEAGWAEKKRQIEEMAVHGVNSITLVTDNVSGDEGDVWPWLGSTPAEARGNPERFDVARLARWRDLLEYIQAQGLTIRLVLEGRNAWNGFDYTQYYRQVVARFGDLPALTFVTSEDNDGTLALENALGNMDLLATIDPYNHPRAIHGVDAPLPIYLNSRSARLASIGTDPKSPARLNQLALDWFADPLAAARQPFVMGFDEARPAWARESWWAVYLGGGVWESMPRPRPVSGEQAPETPGDATERPPEQAGLTTRLGAIDELVLAKRFMESLPVDRMYPANFLVRSGEAFCLAHPGELYALYLPRGGTVEVQLTPDNRYALEWFDPRARAREPWTAAHEIAGDVQQITAPTEEDWAVRIRRLAGDRLAPPAAVSAKVVSERNAPVSPRLVALDAGDPQQLTYEIVTQPRFGRLSGDPPAVAYTPRPGFTGEDRFEWKVTGENGESNIAVMTILCRASGENIAPRALDGSDRVRAGETVTYRLRYSDRDGPGPYHFRFPDPPGHGTLTWLDDEATYTPEDDFHGTDTFTWQVSDGASYSNEARVRIRVY